MEVRGQAAGTAVRGQVRGFTNEPLPGVALVFHHLDLNQQRRLETDAEGAFSGGDFPPGRYRIAILKQGQILWVISGVEVSASGAPTALEINLRDLRRAAEAPPVLDVELQRRVRQQEEEQARRYEVRDHYRQGLAALDRREYEAAIRELEAARDLEPSEALYHAQLGEAYAGADRSTDAIAAYQRTLELDPDDTGSRNNLGVVLARAGRTEEALSAFSVAARRGGEQAPTSYFNWGAVLYNAGRYAEAAERLRQATNSDQAEPMAFYFLGECLFRLSPVRTVGGTEKIEPRPGTVGAFERYLELAPEGKYASAASDYLKRLGMRVPR